MEPKDILINCIFMTMSTVDGDGNPWSTPIYFSHFVDNDELYITWNSSLINQHSKTIISNGKLFISMFDPMAKEGSAKHLGLYLSTENAALIDEKEAMIKPLESLYSKKGKKPKSAELFFKGANRRIWQAKVKSAWTNISRPIPNSNDNSLIDDREPVDISGLI